MLKKRHFPARVQSRKRRFKGSAAPENRSNIIFENLFESAPQAQILIDSNGRICAVNHKAEVLFGYTRQEMLGNPVEMLVPEKDRSVHLQHRAAYFQSPYERANIPRSFPGKDRGASAQTYWVTGHIHDGSEVSSEVALELSAQGKDGTVFPVEILLAPIRFGDELYVLSVVHDITFHRARLQDTGEQAELIRLLQDIAIAANEADSVADAFQFAINRLCQYLGWPVGHALLVEENKVLLSTGIWNRDISEIFNNFRRVSESMRYPAGVGLPGMVLSTAQPIWLTDVTQNPGFTRKDQVQLTGIKTGLGIPVLARHNIVGALEFFNTQTVLPNQRLMGVLTHVSVQLGRVVERKRSEEAQRKSAAQLRMIITSLPLFLWVTDREGKIIMLEGRSVTSLNLKPETLLGRSVFELSNERPELIELIRRAMTGETINVELPGRDSTVFETYFAPYYDVNWAVDGVIGLSFDVSQRKRMENELEEMKHRLMASIENERARLGQQLHDGPLQDLYGAFYEIQDVKNLLAEREQEAANHALNTIQEVSATLRIICGELHPSILVHLGLQRSIRSHAEQLQERLENTIIHLELDDETDESENAMSPSTRLALFRIYQSLINNATRHAQASQVRVRLRLSPHEVVLEVQDNGIGFEKPDHWINLIREGKVGLVSTLERVEGLGGKMEVNTKPGKGTLVRVKIPK